MIRIEKVNGQYIIYAGTKVIGVAEDIREIIEIIEENELKM